jgi:hypothetical protein
MATKAWILHTSYSELADILQPPSEKLSKMQTGSQFEQKDAVSKRLSLRIKSYGTNLGCLSIKLRDSLKEMLTSLWNGKPNSSELHHASEELAKLETVELARL